MTMQIGGTVIVTPYDNPSQFQPDWRHLIAKIWVANPTLLLPAELSGDDYIRIQTNFLQSLNTQCEGFIDRELLPLLRAFDIYELRDGTNVRDYLDALLLTDQPIEVIAEDLGQLPQTIEHYERVYWSCRPDRGIVMPSEMLKTSFAIGVETEVRPNTPTNMMWRFIAARLGYTALMYTWHWQRPAGALLPETDMFRLLARVNMGQLFKLVMSGQVEAIDINGYLAQYNAHERLRFETRAGLERNDATEALYKLVRFFAPQMKATVQTGEALASYAAADQNVDTAQRTIDGTVIQDSGPISQQDVINRELKKALDDNFERMSKS